MSLTKQDVTDIRGVMTDVVMDALNTVVNPRFDRIEAQLDEHSAILNEHSAILNEHSAILNEHSAILNEHSAMLAEHGRRLTSIEQKIDNLDGRLKALEDDVKELYHLIGQRSDISTDNNFAKLSSADKLRRLHADVLRLAQQMNVEL